MSKLLKLRRGTTAQHSTFTGASGEITVDTTKKTLVVHDGTTAGGNPVPTLAGNTFTADQTINGVKVGKGSGSVATNTVLGASAFASNVSGVGNTVVGDSAGSALTGSRNTMIGLQAGRSSTADNNTFVGAAVGYANTTGTCNVGVGGDTASTYTTLRFNTTGSYNTAVGMSALANNTTGINNTSLGYQAGYTISTNGNQTAVGYSALLLATGNDNTGVGKSSLGQLTSGTYNTAYGTNSGQILTTGSFNVYLGQNTNASSTSATSEIVIGAGGITGKGSNTFYVPSSFVYNGANTTTWNTTSDERIKKNIVDNNEGLENILKVRVRNFEYKTADEIVDLPSHVAIKKEGIQRGVVAQEYQRDFPERVHQQTTGVLTVNTDDTIWDLVNAVKHLKAELDATKAELAALKQGGV